MDPCRFQGPFKGAPNWLAKNDSIVPLEKFKIKTHVLEWRLPTMNMNGEYEMCFSAENKAKKKPISEKGLGPTHLLTSPLSSLFL